MKFRREILKQLILIRRFEEKIAEVYSSDVIKSPVHLSIGQEAVAVGVCAALEKEDFISNTYRCHATHIAKGGDLNKMMAELYGKKDGCAGGKGGSMHLVEKASGILPASAVVGTTVPMATGFALALKKKKSKQIVVSMFGDGATEEGSFSESINFAALHKLPIIFICENNKLAIHNPIERRWASEKICERIETYGIKTIQITSGDVFEIYEKTKEAVELARSGNAPIFMEIFTYRYREHVGFTEDLNEDYRNLEEYKKWKKIDQIDLLSTELGKEITEEIELEVKNMIENSIKFAENSSFPNTYEELFQFNYAK